MQKGWDAKGLLRPLWLRYGGRDRLAEAVGTTGSALSSINSGQRRLGLMLGRKLALALDVSLAELGAPLDLAEEGDTLIARLEALEEQVAQGFESLERMLDGPAGPRRRRAAQ